jgi:hypothetical protein
MLTLSELAEPASYLGCQSTVKLTCDMFLVDNIAELCAESTAPDDTPGNTCKLAIF